MYQVIQSCVENFSIYLKISSGVIFFSPPDINEYSSDEDFISEPETEYTVGGSPLTLKKIENFHVLVAILDSGNHGNLKKFQI